MTAATGRLGALALSVALGCSGLGTQDHGWHYVGRAAVQRWFAVEPTEGE
jgi:hypothetical protein